MIIIFGIGFAMTVEKLLGFLGGVIMTFDDSKFDPKRVNRLLLLDAISRQCETIARSLPRDLLSAGGLGREPESEPRACLAYYVHDTAGKVLRSSYYAEGVSRDDVEDTFGYQELQRSAVNLEVKLSLVQGQMLDEDLRSTYTIMVSGCVH